MNSESKHQNSASLNSSHALKSGLVSSTIGIWQTIVGFVFNNSLYKKCLHFYKVSTYILPHKINYLKALMQNNFRAKILLAYPDLPSRWHIIYKIAHNLGYRITNNLASPANVVINFEKATFGTLDDNLISLCEKYDVINYRSKNISKKHVDLLFEKVFGYSISIDPTSYEGLAVKKSDVNAMHDGTIITCPISEIAEGFVYQRLVNCQVNDDMIMEYRVPIFNGTIPFVYLKYRSIDDRFGFLPYNITIEIAEVWEVLTQEEVEKILLFCIEMGIDLGELDVLRDKDDGRLFIVDANNTPSGPPKSIRKKEAEIALKRLSIAFEKAFSKRM